MFWLLKVKRGVKKPPKVGNTIFCAAILKFHRHDNDQQLTYPYQPPHIWEPTVIQAGRHTHQLVNWQIVAQPTSEAVHILGPQNEARYQTRANALVASNDSYMSKDYWLTRWHEGLKKGNIIVSNKNFLISRKKLRNSKSTYLHI